MYTFSPGYNSHNCLSNSKQFNAVYSAARRVFLKMAIQTFRKDSANKEVDNFLPVWKYLFFIIIFVFF